MGVFVGEEFAQRLRDESKGIVEDHTQVQRSDAGTIVIATIKGEMFTISERILLEFFWDAITSVLKVAWGAFGCLWGGCE